jgi:nitroimidazol reductase NimA-like FMN-containing flavoprotein (pyridoxamine 5'-phosphate oxidase superfamily)
MSIDQLQNYGLEKMDGSAISGFLATQSNGVLGLPTGGTPYMIPISYAYDGNRTLYFTYLLGRMSEKRRLSEQTDRARFLVYSVETLFNWQSVLLEGTLSELPESEWGEIEHLLDNVWRPEILQRADLDGGVAIYAFTIEEQSGIRHTGLAPGFREPGE